MALLTTITPFWGRADSLVVWLQAIQRASIPNVCHIIYFVGETIPVWFSKGILNLPVRAIVCSEPPGNSIGHYHNKGAKAANTEWIMKMDVDAIPHERYFSELVNVLRSAKPREWFNCGMMFMSREFSIRELTEATALSTSVYTRVMLNPRGHVYGSYIQPEASNFCCRRVEYLQLGGACSDFKQWGWEDYQQMYMLEKHWRQRDPLPGPIDISNVTQRCRDEIGRPKASELFARNRWLCLLHRWHPPSGSPSYKTVDQSQKNRQVVLDYILKARGIYYGNQTPEPD